MRMRWRVWQAVADARRGCFPFVLLSETIHNTEIVTWPVGFRGSKTSVLKLSNESLISGDGWPNELSCPESTLYWCPNTTLWELRTCRTYPHAIWTCPPGQWTLCELCNQSWVHLVLSHPARSRSEEENNPRLSFAGPAIPTHVFWLPSLFCATSFNPCLRPSKRSIAE